jgi:signal peptidase I
VRDLYSVLGVERDATADEIRDAYFRQVGVYAADRDPESPARQARISELREAYETLVDPSRRAAYDASNDRAASLAEPAERPPRRSRNPLDRLTAGLPRPWRIAIDWIVTIAGAVAIVLAIKAWVVNPYRIPSSSMEPTLHCAGSSGCEAHLSDRVLANRFIYHFRSPHRGEIVVFHTPELAQLKCGAGGTFVKRLIALPGETWEERNGYVFINGRKLNEPYVHADRRDNETHAPQKIPKREYFMMGDNRVSSCDSRVWGPVPRKDLIGPVFATYWPPTRISFH